MWSHNTGHLLSLFLNLFPGPSNSAGSAWEPRLSFLQFRPTTKWNPRLAGWQASMLAATALPNSNQLCIYVLRFTILLSHIILPNTTLHCHHHLTIWGWSGKPELLCPKQCSVCDETSCAPNNKPYVIYFSRERANPLALNLPAVGTLTLDKRDNMRKIQ